jgi:protein-disulfide isomerase/uncharacterized membrane protein
MSEQSALPIAPGNGRRRLCIALIAFIFLSIVGGFIAVELTDVWVRSRVDPDYQSFCAVSEGMNCETVALSDYSTVMGRPVSVWAVAGYAFLALLALLGLVRLKDGFGRGYLLLISLVFVLVGFILMYIMKFLIGSWCLLCLAVDAVNIGLLAMAVLAIRMPGTTLGDAVKYDFQSIVKRPLLVVLVAVAGFGMLGGAWVYGGNLAVLEGTDLPPEQALDSPEKWTHKLHGEECTDQCGCNESGGRPQTQLGIDGSGHQWIGSAEAEMVIHEFTDYQCPHCRMAHMKVRRLLSNHPGKIKVIHRHYPLDQACNSSITRPFHQRACELSKIAICAGRQGRFWEMNDFLFQHADEIRAKGLSAVEVAKRLELNPDDFQCCMDDSTVLDEIKLDVEEGITHKLKGTPAFLIDGKVYYGKIPDEAVLQLK